MADEKAAVTTAQGEEPKKETTPSVEELQAQLKALESELSNVKQTSSQAITKANAESADWKRKYRETLDEATRKEQERTEKENETLKELEAYKTKDRIATYQSKLIEAGYDLETAKKMAADLPEGVPEAFFTGQKEFLAKKEQEVKTKMLDSQKGLNVGMPPSTNTAGDETDAKFRRWMGL